MNELLLNIKSQLIYVLENQLKLKEEFFLREFGTPDSPEIIDDYFNKISDKIVLILENNYSFVMEKSLTLLSKLPGFNDLDSIQKDSLLTQVKNFVENDLSSIIFNKISTRILD